MRSRDIGLTAVFTALYALLTVALGNLSYSWIQVRVSDALLPLSYLYGLPAVIGVTVGCIVANFFSPVGVIDVIFGSIANLVASLLSWKLAFKKKTLACIYPVLVVSAVVPLYLAWFFGVPYWLVLLSVFVGEFISCVLLGYPLLAALEKYKKK
ncbi:MAG: hypothetical protein DRN04_11995 [Thermoprotei archaeon]|nr:MAG: hypothetical protein DRN04_11995 [Thermoprotei archaeon]